MKMLKLLLFILVIIIIISYIVILFFKEHYTYNPKSIVYFSSIKEIKNIYNNSAYFDRLNKIDIKTRNLDNLKKTDLINNYLDNMEKFSINDKHLISNTIRTLLDNLINKNKKNFLYTTWNFAKFSNIENNFPHTHGNIIFIPNAMVDTNLNNKSIETIVHEKVHIFQRTHPELFIDLYTNYWNFKKIKINNISIIDKISRSNPDGVDNNWVFSYNNINIILISLFNKNPNSISDSTNYGIYLDTNMNIIEPIKKKKILKIKEFTNFFGILNNNYHPNEISADIIAKHIINSNNNTKAYINFNKWWNKIN